MGEGINMQKIKIIEFFAGVGSQAITLRNIRKNNQ